MLSLKSPAKINIFLQVNFKRDDGFHDLTTLFHKVGLYDRIDMELTNEWNGIKFTTSVSELPTDESNIAVMAAQRFIEHHPLPSSGVRIHLEKKIPIAAGLGGGSSNAATVLKGMNQLCHYPLNLDTLCELGGMIGSDVNFFLYDDIWAWGRQRGEVIESVKSTLSLSILLVNPNIPILAKDVYKSLKIQLTKDDSNANILQHYLTQSDFQGLSKCLNNDLESAVFALCPELCDVLERLKSIGIQTVRVSGSGPTVFAITDREKVAQEWYSEIQNIYPQSFVVKTAEP